MNLYLGFLKGVERFRENTALEWDGGRKTFEELAGAANIAGHALAQRVEGQQKTVGLLIPNTPYFPIALLGLLGAGHIAVPLNPLLNPEEMALLLDHSESSILIYDPYLEEKAQAAVQQTHTGIEAVNIVDLLQQPDATPSPLPGEAKPEDLSMILYTSGTTGDPKGVMLSHHNVLSNVESFSSVYHFSEEDTIAGVLPLFHTFGMTAVLFAGFMNGCRIYLFPQFQAQPLLDLVMNDKNIILMAVPPMLHVLARYAPEEAAQKHGFRLVISGGGPLPVDIAHLFEQKFQHEVLEGYGLTETSPVVSFNRPGQNRIGTIGQVLPGVEVEVRDQEGHVLPPGEPGELCIRGENVMVGYFKNDEGTKATFWPNGWFRSGDMAKQDEQGYIQIVGRLKDTIVSGGENIYPREIEETLLKFPGVLEAAVVGKPHKMRSEIPYAFIVLGEGVDGQVNESALRHHCRDHLAEYKIPAGFEFIVEMPKTATKKIQKERLKARFADEEG